MKLISKKSTKWEKVRLGRDDEDEHIICHTFTCDVYYLFGKIPVWKRHHSFKRKPTHEWIKSCLGN